MKIYLGLFYALFGLTLQAGAAAGEFNTFLQVAADRQQPMNARWEALMKSADYATGEEIEKVRLFTQDEDWFMRNAGLLALHKINKGQGVLEAKKLLVDKALVVRSAAVDILAGDMTEDHKRLLIEELNKPYNFNKKSSLWIRKQIIEKIAATNNMSDKEFFAKYGFDSDNQVATLSARALEKITGTHVDESKYLEKWKEIVKQKKWN